MTSLYRSSSRKETESLTGVRNFRQEPWHLISRWNPSSEQVAEHSQIKTAVCLCCWQSFTLRCHVDIFKAIDSEELVNFSTISRERNCPGCKRTASLSFDQESREVRICSEKEYAKSLHPKSVENLSEARRDRLVPNFIK